MSEKDPKRISDGFVTAEAGMDSGRASNLLARNQMAMLTNATVRGGFISPRPGIKKVALNFDVQNTLERFQDGRFQGAHFYDAFNGDPQILASIGGRIFKINIASDLSVADISIDLNSSIQQQAWMTQAEDYLVIQDGLSRALIYNGGSLRRAADLEVPSGTVMAYGWGRLWVALTNRRSFVGGDLVYSVTGQTKDLLGFTENALIANGGAFATPVTAGQINAMAFITNLDTSLGQGPLEVFTDNAIFSVNAPVDRSIWSLVTYPIQTVSLVDYGSASQDSTVQVNGDMWFRSSDGIRSFMVARRQFNTWGNTPQSTEMARVIERDDQELLQFSSSILFDNRLLTTCSPCYSDHGVFHRGLIALDFYLLAGISNKSNPAYDGLWAGFRILKILKGRIRKQERAFIFVLNPADEIELWEITRSEKFDNGKDRIIWSFETPSYGCVAIGALGSSVPQNTQLKKLWTGDIWVDQVWGDVDYTVQYRPDQHPCWVDWTAFQQCSLNESCAELDSTCKTVKTYRPQYRSKVKFPQPRDDCDPILSKPYRNAFEFQVRVQVTGAARINRLRIHAHELPEQIVPECPA